MYNSYAPPRTAAPPLHHPVPTHPPRQPERSTTPTASTSSQTSPPEGLAARRFQGVDQGYVRYASPPVGSNSLYGGASTAQASAARSLGNSIQHSYYPDPTSHATGMMGTPADGHLTPMGLGGNQHLGGFVGGSPLGRGGNPEMMGNTASPAPSSSQANVGYGSWGFPSGSIQGMDPTAQMGMQLGAQFVRKNVRLPHF